MRKQFNLKDWLKDKSQKIETRNGRPAHYIGLDRAGWQVFEIFRTNETSEYKTYHDSYLYSGPGESPYDLFIVTPEEELTEWQRFISACLQKHGLLDCGAADRIAKESAAELLSLAREQFIKDGYVIEKKAFHDAVENISNKHLAEMSVQYSLHCKIEDGTRHAIMNWDTFQKVAQKFIDIGKAEALKDLPRWEKYPHNAGSEPLVNGILQKDGSYKWRLYLDGYKIEISDIEKLPGFKEGEK